MSKSIKQNYSAAISQSLLIEDKDNKYLLKEPLSKDDLYCVLLNILEENYIREGQLSSPEETRKFLKVKLAKYQHEVFCCVYLDQRHRVIAVEELFQGTIDGASVYPREVVKSCLQHNAAAVIFAHNHPSGVAEPSQSDERITKRLKDALALVDIRVLDHFVIGDEVVSFAERGLL